MYTSGMAFSTFLTFVLGRFSNSDSSSKVMPSGIPRSVTRMLLITDSITEPLYRVFEPFSGRVEGQGA
jgi:hypothetical protein